MFALCWSGPFFTSNTFALDGSESRKSSLATGMQFVRISGGQFAMGAPPEEPGRDADAPQHVVKITNSFWLGAHEVTQAEYASVIGSNPSLNGRRTPNNQSCAQYKGVSLVGDDFPVTCVSWIEAVEFANALSKRDGLTPAYTESDGGITWDRKANGYRLPTEAEWEFAARAGKSDWLFSGAKDFDTVCEIGNIADLDALDAFGWRPEFEQLGWMWTVKCRDGHSGLAPVGSFHPNDFQLFDMTGNVVEWVWDKYGPYPEAAISIDPIGPDLGDTRIGRGGGWTNPGLYSRVSHRGAEHPTFREFDLGFRLAANLEQ
jgi:formylglycine-generating enzyme required for sulfatase activity